MIEFKCDVFGATETSAMLHAFPGRIRDTVRHWMATEQIAFVGSRAKTGAWYEHLKEKQRHGQEGTWRPAIGKMFKGYIENSENIAMTLHMGDFAKNKGFKQAIGEMQEGFTVDSPEWMPIPIYANLRYANLIYRGGKKRGLFHELQSAGKLIMISHRGMVYWTTKELAPLPLWVGTKNVRIPKQIDFYEQWKKRESGAVRRLEKMIDQTCDQINREADKVLS